MKFYDRENEIAELKRNARNYDDKSFMDKVGHIRTKILSGYEIETRLYTMDDM